VSLKKLKREDKVNIAIGMVDVVTRISAENEKEKNPKITEAELISHLRRRFGVVPRFRSR